MIFHLMQIYYATIQYLTYTGKTFEVTRNNQIIKCIRGKNFQPIVGIKLHYRGLQRKVFCLITSDRLSFYLMLNADAQKPFHTSRFYCNFRTEAQPSFTRIHQSCLYCATFFVLSRFFGVKRQSCCHSFTIFLKVLTQDS